MLFQEVSLQDHKVKGVQVTFTSQVCIWYVITNSL